MLAAQGLCLLCTLSREAQRPQVVYQLLLKLRCGRRSLALHTHSTTTDLANMLMFTVHSAICSSSGHAPAVAEC